MAESTVLSLSYGRLVVKPADKLHGLVPDSFETYQVVDPGDIVIRPTDLQNDWTSLRSALSESRGIITSAYLAFRTKDDLQPEFAHYLLRAYDHMKIFYGLGSGLRQNLRWEDFKYLPILIPPDEEQAGIIRFLRHADRQIERLIQAKRRLIALLEEEKRVTLHQAVTRGLNKGVQLKPAGVPWLDEIPAHWMMLPTKTFLRHKKKLVGASSHDYQLLSLTKRGIIST